MCGGTADSAQLFSPLSTCPAGLLDFKVAKFYVNPSITFQSAILGRERGESKLAKLPQTIGVLS